MAPGSIPTITLWVNHRQLKGMESVYISPWLYQKVRGSKPSSIYTFTMVLYSEITGWDEKEENEDLAHQQSCLRSGRSGYIPCETQIFPEEKSGTTVQCLCTSSTGDKLNIVQGWIVMPETHFKGTHSLLEKCRTWLMQKFYLVDIQCRSHDSTLDVSNQLVCSVVCSLVKNPKSQRLWQWPVQMATDSPFL